MARLVASCSRRECGVNGYAMGVAPAANLAYSSIMLGELYNGTPADYWALGTARC